MTWIIIELNPEKLENPDLDIRYRLPDLIIERCSGAAEDGGYTYAGDRPDMYIVLETLDVARVLDETLSIIRNEVILDNDLREAARVGVKNGDDFQTVYPEGSTIILSPELQGLP